MKPLIYVAGPITGDPFGCVRKSMYAWEALRAADCVPFCPQWSVLPEMVEPQSYDKWLDYDFDVIRRCDALLRLEGVSPGADREVEFARSIGVPVFIEPVGRAFHEWVVPWREAHNEVAS